MTLLILGFLALTTSPEWKRLQCTGDAVGGRYVNYAEGFSVGMPVGLKGKRGQAAGPERGVSIPLSAYCLGVIVVDGEPNSAEWANTAVAVAETAGYALTDNGVSRDGIKQGWAAFQQLVPQFAIETPRTWKIWSSHSGLEADLCTPLDWPRRKFVIAGTIDGSWKCFAASDLSLGVESRPRTSRWSGARSRVP
jgi:hypothetical protein